VDEVAIALPKGREAGMAYLRKYIEDAKSEGLIKAAVQRAGLRGAADK
jgi:polar amino acid transport system substrate-binding protein